MTQADESDYVIGTGDAEIARLGMQHTVWRADAMAAWRAAGFTAGNALLDVGCGPGWATLDLADLVGATGRVVAVDQSARFLEHLRQQARRRGHPTIQVVQTDLAELELEPGSLDGAWLRWVLAFTPDPRDVLRRVARSLRPGGTLAMHEYFDYGAWRVVPPDPVFEEFVAAVMRSWRARGGEPDVALPALGWLEELGFEIRAVRTIVEVASPRDDRWRWPIGFAASAVGRLLELGDITPEDAERMRKSVERVAREGPRMVTPAVLEIIAVRR